MSEIANSQNPAAEGASNRNALSIKSIEFEFNGQWVQPQASPAQRLSTVLRDQLQATDVKLGCNAGDCGACTVLVDGEPVCACLTGINQVRGKHVQTLRGLTASDDQMQLLQNSFLHHGAAQCGICTPGMLVSAVALLKHTPEPDEQSVQDALGGVLCRCTGYRKIIDAVMYATRLEQEQPENENNIAAANVSVGLSLARLDGDPKVTGEDAFGDDVAPLDAQVVRVVRSPYHHGEFVLGDIDRYVDEHAGIDCVLTAADVPGTNAFGVIPPFIDQPVFATSHARFKGEAVAAIVGDADTISSLNLDDFPISWVELAACLSPASAQSAGATQLHEHAQSNLLCEGLVQCGDAQTALSNAHIKVKGSFTTGFIEHAYIEPEAGYAKRVGDTIVVHGCTQAPYMNRDSLASVMGLEPAAVRIVPTSVGGGFGSKLDLSFQPFVALAAWKLNTAVRIAYTRQESMQSTTKRHPSSLQVEIGANKQGRISGFTFEGTFNTGAYASWGPTVANRVPVHASGPYLVSDYRAHTNGVYTNTVPAGAFRGFGVPQAAIAQETLFDELATKLGIDRLEFRINNALDNGEPTVTGQRFDSSVGIKACFEALSQAWKTALSDADDHNLEAVAQGSVTRRGVGIAGGWYGCGNTSLPNPSTIKAGIRGDGSVCLHQGAVDIGQGSNTVVAQIFADSLGVPVSCIELVSADSAITPDAGKTSASRQTFVSGNAARLTALAMREEIARHTNCTEIVSLQIEGNTLMVNSGATDESTIVLSQLAENEEGYVILAQQSYDPPTKPMDENGQGEPYAMYGYAAQMVSLDVDIRLGTVSLQRITAAHDVGRAINPQLVEGQIHGGVAQGVGLALMEEFIPGRTENLHDYLIPTVGDIPPIDTIIIEVEDLHGPFGAKGLGEHVLIPTAPAILNAITHACGARVNNLPATPDKVLAAINDQGVS
ncbi:MAG: molybdopterin-dependent oxidoreductase [Granulosicoccus sp.]